MFWTGEMVFSHLKNEGWGMLALLADWRAQISAQRGPQVELRREMNVIAPGPTRTALIVVGKSFSSRKVTFLSIPLPPEMTWKDWQDALVVTWRRVIIVMAGLDGSWSWK